MVLWHPSLSDWTVQKQTNDTFVCWSRGVSCDLLFCNVPCTIVTCYCYHYRFSYTRLQCMSCQCIHANIMPLWICFQMLCDRFKEFAHETEMIGQERVAAVNDICDQLIAAGHSDAATIAEWKDGINEAWTDLLELIDTRTQALAASWELHKFFHDCKETLLRIHVRLSVFLPSFWLYFGCVSLSRGYCIHGLSLAHEPCWWSRYY